MTTPRGTTTKKTGHARKVSAAKAAPVTTSRATTIRLTRANEDGLRLLNQELRRPINKLVNEAVSDYIETKAQTLAHELERTLASLKAYHRRDPGFRKAIGQFVEAEVTLPDAAEGRFVDLPEGRAVATVRKALHRR